MSKISTSACVLKFGIERKRDVLNEVKFKSTCPRMYQKNYGANVIGRCGASVRPRAGTAVRRVDRGTLPFHEKS